MCRNSVDPGEVAAIPRGMHPVLHGRHGSESGFDRGFRLLGRWRSRFDGQKRAEACPEPAVPGEFTCSLCTHRLIMI